MRDDVLPKGAPDEEDFALEIGGVGVDHVGRRVGDGEIPRNFSLPC
jgi:hypothetical protein